MFLPYKIKKDTVDSLETFSYDADYNQIKDSMLQAVTEEELQKVLIDGSKLQETWFPTEELNFDVFLSHSHGDEPAAKKFAAYLKEKYELKTFIDSCYWNYCDDLLHKLDKKLWAEDDGDGLFNYKKRNYSTTIIHTMLSVALMKMMSKCECFILLESPNVQFTGDGLLHKTKSAWIYQEAEMSKALEIIIPERWLKYIVNHREGGILEMRSFSSDGRIDENQSVTFNLDTSKMHLVTPDLLTKMDGTSGDKALNMMHIDFIEHQRKANILFERRQKILSIAKRFRR